MTTRTLDGPPSTLSTYARAGLGALPLAGRLPFLAGGGGEVPDLELELAEVEVDPAKLAEYCRVCGFTVRETLPATYPHVLAFPIHMALLTDPSFPVPAIGMVHIRNRISQHRPIRVAEKLSLKVRSTKLEPHAKGQTFTLITQARAGGELVWSGEATNLRRGGDSERTTKPEGDALPDPAALPAEAEWRLSSDLGRRYAGVSGDRNPIHLYGLTAKAFGFPRQIAHGMWTKARCVAQLDSRLPQAFAVEVAFKKPILLPAKVEFASTREGDGDRTEFAVRSTRDATPHLAGAVSLA